MALTHSTPLRTAIADLVVDSIDGGTTNPTGVLEFQTSEGNKVAELQFANPAFGNANNGSATSNAITADSNAVGGLMAKCVLKNRDRVASLTGVVAVTGGDINMNQLNVPAGATVAVNSLVYTACP